MNPTTIRPIQARRSWLADETSATTTTTLGPIGLAEPDLTTGRFHETGLPARWNRLISIVHLNSSSPLNITMKRDSCFAQLLISQKFLYGNVQYSIDTLPLVYEVPKDHFESQLKDYSDVFTTLWYWTRPERYSYPKQSALLKMQSIINDKRYICQWLDIPQETLKSLLSCVSSWSFLGFSGEGKNDLPEWLKDTEEILRSFATLSEGWDSYGAKSIDVDVIHSAIELLHRIVQHNTPKPSVVPTNRGGIQIEWHTKGVDLEIEITPHGEIRVFYENPQENAEEEIELGPDLTPLADLIAKVSPSR